VWNESFPLYVGTLDSSQEITLRLFDRDLIGEDFLGEVTIPVKDLLDSSEDSIEKWIVLENEPSKTYNKGEKRPGQISIKLHYPKKS